MRVTLSFPCQGDWLVGTFDRAPARTALLIVSGGNEIAIGPRRAMARLASRVANQGFPVLRFDRRGIGDSEGENRGWRSSRDDILAAWKPLEHLAGRGCSVVALGICDAASALVLHDLPLAARVLANPDLGYDSETDLPPPAAIRAHYRQRLIDPTFWREFFSGRIDLRKAVRGLGEAKTISEAPLLREFAAGLAQRPIATSILVSDRDANGSVFAAAWRHPAFDSVRDHVVLTTRNTASHSFAGDADLAALEAIVLDVLRAVDERRT